MNINQIDELIGKVITRVDLQADWPDEEKKFEEWFHYTLDILWRDDRLQKSKYDDLKDSTDKIVWFNTIRDFANLYEFDFLDESGITIFPETRSTTPYVKMIKRLDGVIYIKTSTPTPYIVSEILNMFEHSPKIFIEKICYIAENLNGEILINRDCTLNYVLNEIVDLLQKKGIIYQNCKKCSHYFLSDEGFYRVGERQYLCEVCHSKKFQTSRDWFIYSLVGWWKDDDEDIQWTELELNELTSYELSKLMNTATLDDSFPCYFGLV